MLGVDILRAWVQATPQLRNLAVAMVWWRSGVLKNLSFDSFSVISVAVVLTVPGLAVAVFGGLSLGLTAVTMLAAIAMFGASVVLSLSLYRIDGLPRAAALLMVAFVAVLPEFSSDTYYAWMGVSPLSADFGGLSLSAITGSSFYLIGVGLPALYLVNRLRTGGARLELHSSQGIELLLLLMVVFYGFLVYVKGYVWPLDTPVLLLLFGVLAWKGFQQYRSAQVRLRPFQRRADPIHAVPSSPPGVMPLLVLYATAVVYLAVPTFADGMYALGLGASGGASGFTYLQDLMPILTKAPLVAVMAMMVWNGRIALATSILVLTVVALWTLVLGVLPFAPLIGGALYGSPEVLTLGEHQRLEVLVAMSQALLAVILLSRLSLTGRSAAALLVTFCAHRMLMYLYPQGGNALVPGLMAGIYVGLAAVVVAWDRARIGSLVGSVVGTGRLAGQDSDGEAVKLSEADGTTPLGYSPPRPTSD